MPLFIFSVGLSWKEFWRTDTITIGGGTINYIIPPPTGPLPFAVLLLLFAALVFLALVIINRKNLTARLVSRNIVCAFVAAGLVAAFRMDYNWLALFRNTIKRNYGKPLPERIVSVERLGLYTFIESVKRTIPKGAAVRQIDIDRKADRNAYFFTILGNYYLLPVMTSKNGRFVWVYNFHRFNYDARTRTLRVHRSTFKARLYELYGDGALFEILD